MSKIISLFSGLYDLINTVFGFVEQFFASLVAIVRNLPGTLSFLTGAIAGLPSFVIAFATITLSITIAYFIANRRTGGSE